MRNLKMLNHNEVIELLNKTFPELKAVDSAEFYGDSEYTGGMWFKGSEKGLAPNGLPLFDYWNDDQDVHKELEDMLHKHGYYAEPYDSGTLMAGIL